MKKHFNLSLGILFIITLTIACSNDEIAPVENENLTFQENEANRWIYFPWEYVMDWRFSRGSCATGPGVCFKNEYGDIWGYEHNGNNPVGEITATMEGLMTGYEDPDEGLIVFRLEGESLHLIFSRSLEEEQFVVENDEVIRGELAERLRREQIVIPAGTYEVRYGNFEHGETYIKIE